MLCPNPECKHRLETGNPAEYVSGVTLCADCGTPLVEELPPAPVPERFVEPVGTESEADEPVELERLTELADTVQGTLLRSLLDEAGIGSVVRRERREEGGGGMFGGGLALAVYVESARLAEAREILAALEAGAEPIDPELAGEDDDEDGR
jgi:hypothetical protein